MTSTQEQYKDDEIDLRELLTSLWANKILILVITAICSIAGIAYAFLAPQLWSAKAVIVAPLPSQLEQLQLRLENFVALRDITTNNPSISDNLITTNKHTQLIAAFSKKKLFTDFIQAFGSFDNKIEFLKTNVTIQQEGVKDVNALQNYLEKWARNISVNQKKNEDGVTLSFGADNAQEARRLLSEYVSFIQTKEAATKNKLLTDKIANQTNTLTHVYQVQDAKTLKRLQEEIVLTEFALRVCRIAGIEAPVENLNNQTIFNIDLGAKALSEKLNILKEIKNFEIINPALADIRLHLDSLKAIPQKMVLFPSYHFLQSPSEPLNRDKPKRSLVVILATMAGLMVGVIIALLRASSLFRDGKRD